MILAVDVGNTRIHLARCEGGRILERLDLPARAWESGDDPVGAGELDRLLEGARRALVASVNPPVSAAVAAWLRLRAGLPVAELAGADVPLVNRTQEPGRVGIDRLLHGFGAWRLARQGCVIAALGSAITVDAVSARGEFLGGAILPGLSTGLWALNARCAQLPALAPEAPPAAIGRSTREAMLSGVVLGAAGAIRDLAARMRSESGEDLRGFLTGGDAAMVEPLLAGFGEVVPDLALRAIALVAEP